MIHRTFIIAYSIENQNVAQEIDNHLSKVNIGIEHVVASHQSDEESLHARLKNKSDFIFLLISDNFLKNTNCMNQGMFMLQNLVENRKAHPIIIDGRYLDESNSKYIAIPTLYDRMSHVIKYMNYWQDNYLELRRQRREIEDNQLESFDEKLKVVRAASSEIGELLKNLRTYNAWRYEDFAANDFELFFNEISRTDLHEQLKTLVNKGDIPVAAMDPPPTPETHFTAPTIILPKEKNPISEVDKAANFVENKAPLPKTEIETPKSSPKSIDEILKESVVSEPPIQEDPIPEDKFEIEDRIELTSQSEPEKELTDKKEDEVVEVFTSRASADNVEEATDIKTEEEALKKKGKKPLLERLIEYRQGKKTDGDSPLQPTTEDKVFELDNNTSALTSETSNNESLYDGIFGDDIEDIDSQPITEPPVSNEEEEKIKILSPRIPFGSKTIEPEKYFDWHQKRDEAIMLINAGKVYAGLNVLRNAVDQNKDNVALRMEYASFLMEKAESYKSAQRELEKVVILDPNNSLAFKKLGIVAQRREDFLLAKNWFEKAASLDPNDADTFYRLGVLVSTKFNDLQDQAVEYFKKAIKKNYNNVDAHYRLGVLLDEHFKKPKKAARKFEITLELNHDHPFANYDLAILHHQFGQFQKAADFYARACEINPVFKSDENDRAFLSALRKEAMESLFEDMPNEETWFEKEDKKVEIEEPKPKGKVVFITGATSGIGKATAELFAKNGFSLILNGRRAERLEATKESLTKDFDADIQLLPFDVRNPADAHTAYTNLPTAWQDIDILVNNAGLAKGFEPIHEGKLEDWNTMIDTNIKGILFMTRMIAPNMVKRKTGHIINVCSTAGHEVYPKGAVYCATKHAVDALTQGMRLDLYKHNLKVSQVSPAHVEETEFAKVRFDWNEEKAKIYEDFQPLKSSDVAAVIYFMASQPDHVNIQDVLMMGKQQANSTNIDRSGR